MARASPSSGSSDDNGSINGSGSDDGSPRRQRRSRKCQRRPHDFDPTWCATAKRMGKTSLATSWIPHSPPLLPRSSPLFPSSSPFPFFPF
ncbi:uncharacterized protein DS421_14g466770 [Arachis hypogaea]|nr:uncharacterized protein DS421_14g466770 [Arachis hypogaea]